ncbi:hypothetical protein ABFA07_008874 [Porites harrisoni]
MAATGETVNRLNNTLLDGTPTSNNQELHHQDSLLWTPQGKPMLPAAFLLVEKTGKLGSCFNDGKHCRLMSIDNSLH